MASCKNKVTQYVEKGYDYKAIEMNCGNTGVRGQTLLCNECVERIEKNKGRGHPDHCEHGVKYTEFDCDCWQCEAGV